MIPTQNGMGAPAPVTPIAQQPAQAPKTGIGGFLESLSDDEKKFLAGTMANWGQGSAQAGIPATPQHQFQRGNQGMLQATPRNEAIANQLRGL